MIEPITFTVEGHASTEGSKQAFVPTYKSGAPVRRHKSGCPGSFTKGEYLDQFGNPCRCPIMTNVRDDAEPHLTAWREAVGWAARQAYKGPVLDCLLVAQFVFYRQRPKAHYGTGANAELLKNSAPAAPGSKPDLAKLARAAEDAMSKVIYTDDSKIVTELLAKRYCDRWEPERVMIVLRPAEAQTVGDLLAADQMELPLPEYEQLAIAV